MFQKIIGIAGVVAVLGVIVMVALSPRTEGFLPDMFDFLKRRPAVETAAPQSTAPVTLPPADTIPVNADTLSAGIPEGPLTDTVITE